MLRNLKQEISNLDLNLYHHISWIFVHKVYNWFFGQKSAIHLSLQNPKKEQNRPAPPAARLKNPRRDPVRTHSPPGRSIPPRPHPHRTVGWEMEISGITWHLERGSCGKKTAKCVFLKKMVSNKKKTSEKKMGDLLKKKYWYQFQLPWYEKIYISPNKRPSQHLSTKTNKWVEPKWPWYVLNGVGTHGPNPHLGWMATHRSWGCRGVTSHKRRFYTLED